MAPGELYDLSQDPDEMINRFNDPGAKLVQQELTDMIHARHAVRCPKRTQHSALALPEPSDRRAPRLPHPSRQQALSDQYESLCTTPQSADFRPQVDATPPRLVEPMSSLNRFRDCKDPDVPD